LKLPKKDQTKLDLSAAKAKFLKLAKLIPSKFLIQLRRMGKCQVLEELVKTMVLKAIKIIHSKTMLSPRYMEKATNWYSQLTKVARALPSVTRCITT